jgi:hypothetical protein
VTSSFVVDIYIYILNERTYNWCNNWSIKAKWFLHMYLSRPCYVSIARNWNKTMLCINYNAPKIDSVVYLDVKVKSNINTFQQKICINYFWCISFLLKPGGDCYAHRVSRSFSPRDGVDAWSMGERKRATANQSAMHTGTRERKRATANLPCCHAGGWTRPITSLVICIYQG